MGFKTWYKQQLQENSTKDAKGTLEAIIASLKKNKDPDKDGQEMLKMANGIMGHFKKEGSMSPSQASWIFQTSKALFK